MAQVFRCRNVGVDCDYAVTGGSEEEIIQQAYDHACIAHDCTLLLPEIEDQLRSGIREEPDSQAAGSTKAGPPQGGLLARLILRMRAILTPQRS